jgi:hypothetical protein
VYLRSFRSEKSLQLYEYEYDQTIAVDQVNAKSLRMHRSRPRAEKRA